MRRLFWFLMGVIAGVYGASWVRRTIDELSENLTPSAVIEKIIVGVKALARGAMSLVSRVGDSPGENDRTTVG